MKEIVRNVWKTRPVIAAVLFLLTFWLFLVVRLNNLGAYYGQFHHGGDEIHTVIQGVGQTFGHRPHTVRAQEGVRWLVRLFSPFAYLKLSQEMGGGIIEGWPSGYQYMMSHQRDDVNDPNIRLFVHSLRIPGVLLLFASVLLLSLYLLGKGWTLAAFSFVALLGVEPFLIIEQRIFYIEPSLLMILNFLVLLCLIYWDRQSVNWAGFFVLSFLSAFALACKFSAVFYLMIPFALLIHVGKGSLESIYRGITFFVLVGIFYGLINYQWIESADHYRMFAHEFFSNFWNYSQSAKFSSIEIIRWSTFQLIQTFGLVVFALPFLIPFGLGRLLGLKKWFPWVVLAAVSFLSVSAVIAQKMYVPRNFIPYFGSSILVYAVSLQGGWEWISGRLKKLTTWRKVGCGAAVLILFLPGSFICLSFLNMINLIRHFPLILYLQVVAIR